MKSAVILEEVYPMPAGSRIRSKGHPYIPSYMDLANGPEECVVCGDAATGYHYRCMTCEGCKGFFRRTIQKDLQYLCKGVDDCSVAKSTRNQCQKCRFKKCVQVGMAVDLVLNDNQRQAKRRLIEENRERKKLEDIRNRLKTAAIEDSHSSDEEGEERLLNSITNAFHRFFLGIKREKVEDDVRLTGDQLLAPFVKIVVQFAKSVPIFAELAESDKTILLTSSWFELLLLYLCLQYDASADGIRLPTDGYLRSPPVGGDGDDAARKLVDCARRLSHLGMEGAELAFISLLLIVDPDKRGLSSDGAAVWHAQEQLLSGLRRHQAADLRRFGKVLLQLVDLKAVAGFLQPQFVDVGWSPLVQLLLGRLSGDR